MAKKVILNYDLYHVGCKGDKIELTREIEQALKTAGADRGWEKPYYDEIKATKKTKQVEPAEQEEPIVEE